MDASGHQVPVSADKKDDLVEVLAAGSAAAAGSEAAEAEDLKEAVPPARASADGNTTFSEMEESTHTSLEDVVNVSAIYQSNAEYFRKLEELKAAHVAAMAKLEEMYQNKLNLKGTQPVITREGTPGVPSRSVLGKHHDCPATLMQSLSEPDLAQSSSVYASSSEDELSSLEKDDPRKSRAMTFAKQLITNMWKNFSVEDYIQSDYADSPSAEKPRKKVKGWVPRTTVPEPFQMTIREQKRRDENKKSRMHKEMARQLLEKEEEEAECRKKFRANPVPEYVFLPLYRELVRQNEERRQAAREKSREALLASQRPFKFMAREEQKQAAREKLKDFFKPKKKTSRFKARPIPRSTYSPPAGDGVNNSGAVGSIRTRLRAWERPRVLSPEPCRRACRILEAGSPGSPDNGRSKPRARWHPPGAENLPEKFLKQPAARALLDPCTSSPSGQGKVLAAIGADEDNLKETRWPYLSPRRWSPVRSPSSKPVPGHCSPPRHTASSREREQAIRRSLEDKKMLEEERNRMLTKQKQRLRDLQKLLTARAKAYSSHESFAQVSQSRIESLRRSEKERMKEYRKELEEREERLNKRPLLFERVAQKNARIAAEKCYSNTLKVLGISDEFVSKKGQSGKIVEFLSSQEMTGVSEDEESFSEEKIEEKENGEEDALMDTNSQDSGKEKGDATEESGEENSVEA